MGESKSTYHKHQLDRRPYPRKVWSTVAKYLDSLGIMFHALQERLQAGHVLLHTASAELTLYLHGFIPHIFKLGIVEIAFILGRDGGFETCKCIVENEARLGRRWRRRRCWGRLGRGPWMS